MNSIWVVWMVVAVFIVDADPSVKPQTGPIEFQFVRKSGPGGKRKQPYDSKVKAYFLHVHDIARFRITKVVKDVAKKPVVLHITGMLEKPEGPLTMRVDSKKYLLYHKKYNKELFRIKREKGTTTIEFLDKGKALLKPGVQFQYIDFFRD